MKTIALALSLMFLVASPAAAAECGEIPGFAQALLRQLAAQAPMLIKSANDDDRRAWALMAAEQLAFSVSPEWGTKKAGPMNPPSKDAVARHVNGRLCSWDIVDGNSREVRFTVVEDITGQVFIPVTPRNHVGAAPAPPAPVDPPPATDLRGLLEELRAELETAYQEQMVVLLRAIAELRAEVEAVKARPFPTYVGSNRFLGSFTLTPK
jgi:hypothetical protein